MCFTYSFHSRLLTRPTILISWTAQLFWIFFILWFIFQFCKKNTLALYFDVVWQTVCFLFVTALYHCLDGGMWKKSDTSANCAATCGQSIRKQQAADLHSQQRKAENAQQPYVSVTFVQSSVRCISYDCFATLMCYLFRYLCEISNVLTVCLQHAVSY